MQNMKSVALALMKLKIKKICYCLPTSLNRFRLLTSHKEINMIPSSEQRIMSTLL